jgi:hypothetical protein
MRPTVPYPAPIALLILSSRLVQFLFHQNTPHRRGAEILKERLAWPIRHVWGTVICDGKLTADDE